MDFWVPQYRWQLLKWFQARGVKGVTSKSKKVLLAMYYQYRKGRSNDQAPTR